MLSKPNSWMIIVLFAAAAVPAFAQLDIKATYVKHLKTSKDFTLKVADQMPEASYDFKLTPPQMSFAEQIVHLSQEVDAFSAVLSGGKPNPAKPAMNKKDVIAFVQQSFDHAIERVSKLTPEQISKSYNTGDGSMTGLEVLMFALDHTTHHRASAEMYLRAKGIKPTDYEF
ncbi:MAG TPA: DinB family protein [Bryobacteraceae bacterium]|jgi:uncharacterized damage-inducible protein DinB|nr:DinB family protein [Bryobacteraceae bacterium]